MEKPPVIRLYQCRTCEAIYDLEAKARECFLQGNIALNVPKGSVFKTAFEACKPEKDKPLKFQEGKSYFIVLNRDDSVRVGHYSTFSGLLFEELFKYERIIVANGVTPKWMKEICREEFEETRGYFGMLKREMQQEISQKFGITVDNLRKGEVELLPRDRLRELKDMRRKLAEATAREEYELAKLYHDAIVAIEEEITFAQHQR